MKHSQLIICLITIIFFSSCARHNDSAGTYWFKATELSKQGRYLESAKMFEKAALTEKASTAPKPKLLSLSLNGAGYHYSLVGQYEKAINYLQQALEIDKERGAETSIAAQLMNIGGIYRDIGQYDKALETYHQALVINKIVGEPDSLAKNFNSIGTVHKQLGQYKQALIYYNQALKIDKETGNEVQIATYLNNIGDTHGHQGQYDLALKHIEQALIINNRLQQADGAATNLDNIARIYNSRGQHDQAIKYHKQALTINKRLGREPDVARVLNNIGIVYNSWGRYDDALNYFQQALDIANKIGLKKGTATGLNNIADIHMRNGHIEKAIESYREALDIYQQLGEKPTVAIVTNNLGHMYILQGNLDKATELCQEALAINRKIGHTIELPNNLGNLGTINFLQGNVDRALEYYQEAYEGVQELGDEPRSASILDNIGHIYYFMGDVKAIDYLQKSIAIKEKIRRTATGDIRRDYLASQILPYQLMASTYLNVGDSQAVLEAIEQSRARLLVERIAGIDSQLKIPTLEEVQANLAQDEAILLFSNIENSKFILMAISNNEVVMQEISKESFLAKSQKLYKKSVLMLLEKQRGKLIEQDTNLNPITQAEKQQNSNFQTAVNYYRSLITKPDMIGESNEFGLLLYELLLEPALDIIQGKSNVIIVPDGILGFLPFETLVTRENNYLVQEYNIRYTQSLTIDKLLRSRDYTKKEDRGSILAMGGAVYNQLDNDDEEEIGINQLTWLQKETDKILKTKRSARMPYRKLGMASWSNLPGTLSEVKQLSTIIEGGETLTGKEVSESMIKQYSSEGKLAQYKVLHFATHGMVVPMVPELSALVLSQFKEEQGGEDGYLRMGEIAELDLAADFVNLSACETGLGKIYGGEGVVGLTQSFLIAGANGLSVSLWQVADESTSIFMTELYQKVQDTGISYNQALTEVKRDFINGKHGKQLQSPYYWSPFVYYGQ